MLFCCLSKTMNLLNPAETQHFSTFLDQLSPLPSSSSTTSSSTHIYSPHPHVAQPYPISYPVPYPQEIDQDRASRMKQQTLELGEWMRARGVGVPASSTTTTAAAGRGDYEERGKARSTGEEMDLELEMGRRLVEGTMVELHQAEQRAGFSRRVDHSMLIGTPTTTTSNILDSMGNGEGGKKVRKSSPAQQRRKTIPRVPPSPGTSSSTFVSPNLNPAPVSTPSNIPPAPYFPRPPLHPRSSRPPVPPEPPMTSLTSNGKPALLSTAQKKANHIASEQKRRKAIREGYELLCSTVPTLRFALEELPEEKGRKKNRKSKGVQEEGEKIDGRAGPRSEAIVLGKCNPFSTPLASY